MMHLIICNDSILYIGLTIMMHLIICNDSILYIALTIVIHFSEIFIICISKCFHILYPKHARDVWQLKQQPTRQYDSSILAV